MPNAPHDDALGKTGLCDRLIGETALLLVHAMNAMAAQGDMTGGRAADRAAQLKRRAGFVGLSNCYEALCKLHEPLNALSDDPATLQSFIDRHPPADAATRQRTLDAIRAFPDERATYAANYRALDMLDILLVAPGLAPIRSGEESQRVVDAYCAAARWTVNVAEALAAGASPNEAYRQPSTARPRQMSYVPS